MRPSYKRPYYYIHNVNTKRDVPTSPNRSTAAITSIKDSEGNILTIAPETDTYDKIMNLNMLSSYTFTQTGAVT